MTKLYFVRHGQTDYNKENRFQGVSDIPLNDIGKKQAQKVALELKNVNFEAIYYSPLIRAKETAEAVRQFHKQTNFFEAPEIIERDFGVYEGMKSIKSPPDYGLWDYNLEAAVLKGGESMEDMKKRIYPFLNNLFKKHPNTNVCLVCHGGVGFMICQYFNGRPESGDLWEFSLTPNGGTMIFEKK